MRQALIAPTLMAPTLMAVVVLSAAALAGAAASASPPVPSAYQVPPPKPPALPKSGWGLSAHLNGQVLNADANSWVDDPDAKSGAMSAGYGWRDHASSVLLGYQRRGQDAPSRTYAATYNAPGQSPAPGVLGFNFTLKMKP